MNGSDCICVALLSPSSGVLRRGLRAISFVSLQLHRGLAAVRQESLLSSALIAETARGERAEGITRVFLKEDDAEFTLHTNQTVIFV